MIDPDNIILADINKNNKIEINNIPEFDFQIWDLENEKDFKKYIQMIEKEVRQSFEYKEFIHYIKDNFDMHKCSFLNLSDDSEINISLDLHHYPLTLFDIVLIVYRKRLYYQERLDVQLVAKEVMMLHYKLLVGLIPLSKTVHQLVHDGKLFIPVQNVLGNYNEFIRLYKEFMDVEQLDIIDRIERYSMEESDLLNTSILDTNLISFNVNNQQYQLPNFNNIENYMNNRIEEIKQNNYALPIHEEKECVVENNQIKEIIHPFVFVDKNNIN